MPALVFTEDELAHLEDAECAVCGCPIEVSPVFRTREGELWQFAFCRECIAQGPDAFAIWMPFAMQVH